MFLTYVLQISYNNETFAVIILFTKCSKINPFSIIIVVYDESSMLQKSLFSTRGNALQKDH